MKILCGKSWSLQECKENNLQSTKSYPEECPCLITISSLSNLIDFFFFGSNITNFPSVNNSGKGQIQKWRLKVQKHIQLSHLIFFILGAVGVHLREQEGLFSLPVWQQAFKKKFCSQQTLVIFLKTFTVNSTQVGIVPFFPLPLLSHWNSKKWDICSKKLVQEIHVPWYWCFSSLKGSKNRRNHGNLLGFSEGKQMRNRKGAALGVLID